VHGAYAAYGRPLSARTSLSRSRPPRSGVRPVSSHSGKLSVGGEAFNFNRRQPQDVSRCWWPQLGEDEVVEVIAPFTVQRRIGRPANSS